MPSPCLMPRGADRGRRHRDHGLSPPAPPRPPPRRRRGLRPAPGLDRAIARYGNRVGGWSVLDRDHGCNVHHPCGKGGAVATRLCSRCVEQRLPGRWIVGYQPRSCPSPKGRPYRPAHSAAADGCQRHLPADELSGKPVEILGAEQIGVGQPVDEVLGTLAPSMVGAQQERCDDRTLRIVDMDRRNRMKASSHAVELLMPCGVMSRARSSSTVRAACSARNVSCHDGKITENLQLPRSARPLTTERVATAPQEVVVRTRLIGLREHGERLGSITGLQERLRHGPLHQTVGVCGLVGAVW